jgi:hypothetical protein
MDDASSQSRRLGAYSSLEQFCTCTKTYQRYAEQIDPFPKNPESIEALQQLCEHILDPIIQNFGSDRFQLTYGFCSTDLKRWLAKKDPATGTKHGRVTPSLDQHMAHEKNRNGKYYCDRLGAACDFRIIDLPSDELVTWILGQKLPFDSLYYYKARRPIHISYGPQHKRDLWAFTQKGTPTRKGTEYWQELIRSSYK